MPIDVEKIRSLRKGCGLTQEQAAIKAGFSSKQAWNNLERGRQSDITLSTLERVAKVLGVKAKDLLK